MNKELIERLKLATVAIGYAVPKGVPEWLGTGLLVSDGTAALTCRHVMEGQSATQIEEGVPKDLCCFMCKNDPEGSQLIKFPISGYRIIYELHLQSTHFLGSERDVDVARVELDNTKWVESGASDPIPTLEIDRHLSCEVGEEIVVVGYPSPIYLIAQPSGKPNCLGPLLQFGRIAGILPGSTFPLPHLLALDVLAAHGSSGSPVVRCSDGLVVGIMTGFLPVLTRQQVWEIGADGERVKKEMIYPIPTAISYALPSNFFAEFASQSGDSGRVNF